MISLNKLLLKLYHPNKFTLLTFLALGFLGFLDASYLTVNHYFGTPLNCTILKGCEVVATSKYSMIGPVPVALLGLIYYSFILITIIFYIDTDKIIGFRMAGTATVVGAIASVYFTLVQALVIHAYCLYCLMSAADSFILLALAMILFKRENIDALSQ